MQIIQSLILTPSYPKTMSETYNTRAHTHMYTHTHTHARKNAHTHTHTRKNARARTHTRTHPHPRAHTHASTPTRTRAHTQTHTIKVGNLTGGIIADQIFQRRYKLMLVLTFAFSGVCFVGYMLALPSVFSPTKALIPGGSTGQ